MSIQLVKDEILKFLSTAEPEVLCIKGEWGVGKTFAWNLYLTNARDQNAIALPRYAYVSLFGIGSLDELKYSVFENSMKVSDIGIEPSLESLKSNTAATADRLGRKSLRFLQQVPLFKNNLGGLAPVWYMSVRKTIICIDDIERRGKDLTIRDVMGLASNLKEHKGCKVALILNDGQFGEDQAEFQTFYEKVVDYTLKYVPTPKESALIALTEETMTGRLLANHCVSLGISNIRLIKKIEQVVRK